jgi:hypothetical protein
MRLGPATLAALLSRTFQLLSFAGAKDHRAKSLRGAPLSDDNLKLALQAHDSVLPSFRRKISEEAVKPGHQHTGHVPNFPPVTHSREITGNADSFCSSNQNVSRFDCRHSAVVEKLWQRQIAGRLCKNCEVMQLPVEAKGKGVL